MPQNDELHIALRKNQNTLSVIGTGVIVFGVWSVLKGVMSIGIDASNGSIPSMENRMQTTVFWVLAVIILAVDLGLRLYVGLCAIAEGRGRKQRYAYIVLAFLMVLSSILMVVLSVYYMPKAITIGLPIVAIVVETTSCVLLVEMALSAIKVKQLSKAIRELEG